MADRSPLIPLESAIAALLRWFRAGRVKGMVIGGVAASLLGRPRTTRDVDAVVWITDPNDWGRFLDASTKYGFAPRIDDPLAFALRSRVLLLRHAPSGIDVDVSFGALPFEEEAIARSVEGKLGSSASRSPHLKIW